MKNLYKQLNYILRNIWRNDADSFTIEYVESKFQTMLNENNIDFKKVVKFMKKNKIFKQKRSFKNNDAYFVNTKFTEFTSRENSENKSLYILKLLLRKNEKT